ncbi:MAG: hypothetical protein JJ899_08875 [Alphaproteobacteria bacterium]|nr:hypothetical protein [Alphaproteobacteria bacterium]
MLTRRIPGVLLAGALLFSAHGALAAQLVVIDVSGADLKPGDVVDSGSQIDLPAGASLTLIGEDGTPVQLKGPYKGAPGSSGGGAASGDTNVVGALAQLFSTGGTTDTTLGVTRAGGAGEAVPSAYAIPVDASGDFCVLGGSPTFLWRVDSATQAPVVLRAADGSWQGRQQFAAGQDRLPLPPNFPNAPKQAFTLTFGAQESSIVLHKAPAGLTNPGLRAAWLVRSGCELQARALLAAL